MTWSNLTRNKCPKCSRLFDDFSKETIRCKCGFSISMPKFRKICDNILNKKRPEAETDNQQALSNM